MIRTALIPLVVAGTVLLVMLSGMVIGLVGLGRVQRSAAWWIMVGGVALCLASPLLFAAAMWKTQDYYNSRVAAMSAGQPLPPPLDIDIYTGCGTLAAFYGLMAFSGGFAHHGTGIRRLHASSRGLERDLAAMDPQGAMARQEKTTVWTPEPIPEPGALPPHFVEVITLLACAGVVTGIWACWNRLSLYQGEKSLMAICLAVGAASALGIWTGLNDLRKAHGSDDPNRPFRAKRRGPGMWLMRSGALCSFVPTLGFLFLFLTGGTILLNSLGHVIGAAIVPLLIPLGLVFFITGFALHGLGAVRQRERIAELGQVKAAMEEEMSRGG